MKKKEPILCPLCGREVTGGDMYQCNFEQFAGRAEWHMSFEPRITMCHECSQTLLNYMERWFKTCDKTHTYKKFSKEWKRQ